MQELADYLNSGIRLTTPILFCAIASAISAKAGIVNLAIESKMITGAFVGILVAAATGSNAVGILAAAAAAALMGLLLAAMNWLGVDLIIFAIGLNLAVLELTVFLTRTYFGGVGTWAPDVDPMRSVFGGPMAQIPFVGEVLRGINALVVLAGLGVLALAYALRTRSGRHLLAIGESPEAARAVGLRIGRLQAVALVAAGALAGLGGAFLSVGDLGLYSRGMTDERGWIGITAALLAVNNVRWLIPAAALFGFADAATLRLQNVAEFVPPPLIQFLPQTAALIALIGVGLRASRQRRPADQSGSATLSETLDPVAAPPGASKT